MMPLLLCLVTLACILTTCSASGGAHGPIQSFCHRKGDFGHHDNHHGRHDDNGNHGNGHGDAHSNSHGDAHGNHDNGHGDADGSHDNTHGHAHAEGRANIPSVRGSNGGMFICCLHRIDK